jgi:hypothetical protein
VSGWDSKLVYPEGAVHTVTVKATYVERIAWREAARKYHKGTAGGFLSFAAAFTIAALNVVEERKTWPEV